MHLTDAIETTLLWALELAREPLAQEFCKLYWQTWHVSAKCTLRIYTAWVCERTIQDSKPQHRNKAVLATVSEKCSLYPQLLYYRDNMASGREVISAGIHFTALIGRSCMRRALVVWRRQAI